MVDHTDPLGAKRASQFNRRGRLSRPDAVTATRLAPHTRLASKAIKPARDEGTHEGAAPH
jgi:hypothetical protein